MIIQSVVCDLCFQRDGSIVDANVTRTVSLDKKQAKAEVCNDCDVRLKEMFAPFFDAARRISKKRTAPAEPEAPQERVKVESDAEGPFLCVCGREFETPRGINRHTNHPPAEVASEPHYLAA